MLDRVGLSTMQTMNTCAITKQSVGMVLNPTLSSIPAGSWYREPDPKMQGGLSVCCGGMQVLMVAVCDGEGL